MCLGQFMAEDLLRLLFPEVESSGENEWRSTIINSQANHVQVAAMIIISLSASSDFHSPHDSHINLRGTMFPLKLICINLPR